MAAPQVSAEASDQQAYDAAIKCYLVAGHSHAERKRAGDDAKAALYDTKAHASFDLAVKFGQSLGRSGKEIEADILAMQDRELPKLVQDDNYDRQSAAVCKALGLL